MRGRRPADTGGVGRKAVANGHSGTPDLPRWPALDAWLSLMLTDASLQGAFLAVAGAALPSALPLTEALRSVLLLVLLPLGLALTALIALKTGSERIRDPFEARFWGDLRLAAGFLAAAAVARVLTLDQHFIRPFVPTGLLLFMAYAMVLLASEAQPHREGFWRSEQLERRLSLLTLATFGAGLLVYFVAIPALIGGRLQDAASQATILYAVVAALLTLRFALFARRVDSLRWRTIYQVMAIASLALTLFHTLRAGRLLDGGAGIHGTEHPWLWSVPLLLWVFAVRLRHYPFPARWQPADPQREPSEDAVEQTRLGLDFRTLTLALGVPAMHFVGYQLDFLAPEAREAREIWMLCWTAGLGVLAFGQQRINELRLLSLLAEQRKIARTLAAGERRLFLVEERKAADEALYYSREKYAKAFRTGSFGLVTLEAGSGRHLYANKHYLSLMGLSRDHLSRLTWPDLLAPEEQRRWEEMNGRLRSEGEVREQEFQLRALGGQERRVSLSARRLADRNTVSYVGICRDLTGPERRRDHKIRQRQWFEDCADGALVLDGGGRIMAMNRAARERLGSEMMFQDMGSMCVDEPPPVEDCIVAGPELSAARLASSEGRQWLGRLRFRVEDGRAEDWSCWWMPLARDGKRFKDRLVLILDDDLARRPEGPGRVG